MKVVQSSIISCSRRTDIPAFLMDWIADRIRMGQVEVMNPFSRKVSLVSLHPSDVLAWVWWSKNFGPWIKVYKTNPDLFLQYPIHIFNFTINSISELESGLKLPLKDRFEQLTWLIENFGIDHVQVRFDPIVFYQHIDSIQILNNLNDFNLIMSEVSKMGIRDIIFSFTQAYSKVKNRMYHRAKKLVELTLKQKKKEIDSLIDICTHYDITLHTCCQPDLVGYHGIQQAHCINGELISKLSNSKIAQKRDPGQRESCGCQLSRDIGGYSGIFKCNHNCDYCYANPTKE